MQQEYRLHCEPLSSFRSHSTSSPRRKSSLLYIPAFGQAGNLIKRSRSWGLRQSGWRVAGWWIRGEERKVVSVKSEWWCVCRRGGCEGLGHDWALTSGVGFRVSDGELERICSIGQGGRVFIAPSIPPPSHLPSPTTTCLQATTSVPREMSATEKKAHKGLTFHMAGSLRLKRPDNPRRLD